MNTWAKRLVHLSVDDQLDASDLLLDSYDYNVLFPYSETSFHFFDGMMLPEDLPTGCYYLILHSDHGEQWVEENEENNYLALPFKVYVESDISVTNTFTHEICEGEMYNDAILTESQTFIDTITLTNPDEFFTYDSIAINEVIVLQNSYTKIDLALEIGTEYNGTIITSDTIITKTFLAANGCDSLVTTSIQITTGLNSFNENELSLSVFPNPTTGSFLLNFKLSDQRELIFYVMTAQGEKINIPLSNNEYSAGEHQLELDWKDFAAGIYFIGVESARQIRWHKIILVE